MIYLPTELLKARGYKLQGVMKFQGLTISIENKKGSYRAGVDSDGHKWKSYMYLDYGGIRDTEGKDGEYVDAYIGPAHNSDRVFVVHQNDPITEKYDEDKCILGMKTAREAKKAYIRQYDRPGFFGSMDEYSMDEFKELLKKRKGIKLKKSGKEKIMRTLEIVDLALEKEFDLALDDLKKNLAESGEGDNAGPTTDKAMILEKSREAVRSGKLDLIDAGIIELRLNKNMPLEKAHKAALGLSGVEIEGLRAPASGRSAVKLPTGTPLQQNSVVTTMLSKQQMIHTYQDMNGVIVKVSGKEILAEVQKLVRKGLMNLTRSGDIERFVNTGLPIRPEVLRAIFI